MSCLPFECRLDARRDGVRRWLVTGTAVALLTAFTLLAGTAQSQGGAVGPPLRVVPPDAATRLKQKASAPAPVPFNPRWLDRDS